MDLVTVSFVVTDPVLFTRALADPTRWRIVQLVSKEALCVCELADILQMPQSTVSSHVQIIRKAGLLDSEKCEKWTYFRICQAALRPIHEISKVCSELKEIQADLTKAKARLQERHLSCCPGPKRLSSPKANLTNAGPI